MFPLLLALGCSPPATPRPVQPEVPTETLRAEGRVILVTIDGVRWQEATDPALMPSLSDWAVFGNHRLNSRVATSSLKPLSMPGYHALMSGHTAPCTDNTCDRIAIETLPESLIRRLDLPQRAVAVFASWGAIPMAAASQTPASFILDTNVPTGNTEDVPPWPHARFDAETSQRAVTYFERYTPRFLWISFLDSDEHAHRDQHDEYLTAIQQYDRFLTTLQQTIAALGLTETTTIILTTDHGRGRGPFWTSHGHLPGARQMFLAATGPWVGLSGPISGGLTLHQADVRPTIERLLGLTPTPCEATGCGAPIPELTPR
ncbi:MAG: membrane-anchored protein YejM (alkaline phosphatase superfamily) [Myxococcota bacterium]|jgi:membrane-anchored protein YejM (alkaline phosphatase superfamily)